MTLMKQTQSNALNGAEARRMAREWMAKHERQPLAAAELPAAAPSPLPNLPPLPSISVDDVPVFDIGPSPPLILPPGERTVPKVP